MGTLSWTIVAQIMLITSPTRALWNTKNLFQNCHIVLVTFEITFNPPNLPYVYNIHHSNPFTPIVLNQFGFNETHQWILGLDNSRLGPHAASRRIPVAIIHSRLDINKESGLDYFTMNTFMQRVTLEKLYNTAYIFQHTDDPFHEFNYKLYFTITGIAILILFSSKYANQLFIPCILCGRLKPEKLDVTSSRDFYFSKMSAIWFALNSNLHQSKVALSTFSSLPGDHCYTRKLQVRVKIPESFKYCTLWSLSKTLNFTMNSFNDLINHFVPQRVIDSRLVSSITTHRVQTPYRVDYNNVQFVFVSPLPTVLNGMSVFLSPFDDTVWVTLILSTVLITVVIRVSNRTNTLLHSVIGDFLNVNMILIGQFNGCCWKMFYHKKFVAVPILIVWMLGGCYIIMNNLYTGSVFSFLSAVMPPIFPSSFKDLVDSNIPILTMSGYADKRNPGLHKSIIKEIQIPRYTYLFR